MSCQKDTATIVERGSAYVLAVKDNLPTLYADLMARFAHVEQQRYEDVYHRHCTQHDRGHGLLETRRCDVLTLAPNDPLWGMYRQSGGILAVWSRSPAPGRTVPK